MTTTSSTTSTASSTTPATAASVTSAAAQSLLSSLDSGSGVDTNSVVTSLVEAQFATKRAALSAKYDTLTSQISAVATLKSNIADFTKAFSALAKGGTLASQPVVSNSNVLTASTISGASVGGLSATVKVSQLATGQTAISGKLASPTTTTFDTGTLTLKLGTATFDSSGAMTTFTGTDADADGTEDSVAIDITASNNTVSGIAAAINAKNAGVTATVVTDADGGAYLAVKGRTGAAQAFTLTADTATSSLAHFNVGPGASAMTISTQAKNARLNVDGVDVERTGNEVSDLVSGVKLTLTNTGTTTLSATRPTVALTNAVTDFVETYNQITAAIREQTDPVTGALRSDTATRSLQRSLAALTSKVLLPGAGSGAPATLAAIGVRTNRDGSLQVDDTALARALADSPDAVEAMFAPSTSYNTGLLQAMQAIDLAAGSSLYGLGASKLRYTDAQSEITKQQAKVADQATSMTTRLTQQFSSMNAKVSAYKSTMAFMKQQVDNWTKSGS